jgi:transcriptional regulator with XRE-family HTH domain
MDKFYKRVHIKLIELDRKRSWLLEQTGIRPSTWSSWEKYGRMPPADRALAVADALGVSLEYLVAGRETPFDFRGSDPLIMRINQQLGEMSEQQLRRVLTIVNTIHIEETGS